LPVAILAGAPGVASAGPPPSEFALARLQYGGGGDWYGNPSSLPNLLAFVRAQTTVAVAPQEARVSLMDENIFSYPVLYMTGHGNVSFSPAEGARLRQYLEAGGFLHADDNYGMDASLRRELARVFPDRQWVELPPASLSLPQGCRRSMNTTANPHRRWRSSKATASWCCTHTSATWATVGRMSQCTVTRRRSTWRRCAWAPTSSSGP
jgi:hypothetical protein